MLIVSLAATNSASKLVITRSPPLTSARTGSIPKVVPSTCPPPTSPTNSRFAREITRMSLVATLSFLLRALARHTVAPNYILMYVFFPCAVNDQLMMSRQTATTSATSTGTGSSGSSPAATSAASKGSSAAIPAASRPGSGLFALGASIVVGAMVGIIVVL